MERDRIIGALRAHESALRARGINRLALFGSFARVEDNVRSDVDLLVDIDESRDLSLLDFSSLRLFLSDLLGRPVDLAERPYLDDQLRSSVFRDAIDVLR